MGFLWATQSASLYLNAISPYIDKKLTVKGEVKSVNIDDSQANSLSPYVRFKITEIADQRLNAYIDISLRWNEFDSPQAGQIWFLQIKTKVVHSYLNEGGFDSQRFALANRMLLSGVVTEAKLIDEKISIRQQIINQTKPYFELFEFSDVMYALAFGERGRLTSEHKQLFFETGIAHLLAISGMHILMIYFLALQVMKTTLFLFPVKFINFWIPVYVGLICALFYAWLSGLNPPALRASLALILWATIRMLHNNLSSWQMINRIIAILLIIDPLMILSESFWLSCYAVISLNFISHWAPKLKPTNSKIANYWWQLCYLQLLLMMLLLPLQFLIFQGTSGISLITNLFAIPVITFFTLPAILLTLVASCCDAFYLSILFSLIAEVSLEGLYYILRLMSGYWLDFSSQNYLISFLGWTGIILWRTAIWRRYGITVFIMLLLFCSPLLKKENAIWQIDMLDVGHGLAIVIRQGNSAILYDTGASWQTSSAAERIIVPFLKWHNLTLEGVIISHEHDDHAGGVPAIVKHYPNVWIMSSSTSFNNDYACKSGELLKWQTLNIESLWPENLSAVALNPESCVIRINDGKYSILLTGDLEKKQERVLVEKYRKLLFSTILQMPHHGSNTSSSYAFLANINPDIAISSTSRYNPWQLPSNKTLNRYKDLNINQLFTAFNGQISIQFYANNWQIFTYREQIKPRWYHDWVGALPIYR